MTKETLISKVNFLLDPDSPKELQLFGLKKNDDTPYKINVDRDFTPSIIKVFGEGVKLLICDSDYTIVDYSTADERKGRYYRYDLPDKPQRMKVMADVIGNANVTDYDFANDKVEGLAYLIAVFSNGTDKTFVIYKQLSTVEKVSRTSKTILGMWGDDVLKEAHDTYLRITPPFQMLYLGGEYYMLNERVVESDFQMHDVLKRQAGRLVKKLKDKQLILETKKLDKYKDNPAFCRKLVKVLNDSVVLKDGFDRQQVFDFIDRDAELKQIINTKQKDGVTYVDIVNKQTANAFLEILNDEFVKSEMSDLRYKAPDKDNRN